MDGQNQAKIFKNILILNHYHIYCSRQENFTNVGIMVRQNSEKVVRFRDTQTFNLDL